MIYGFYFRFLKVFHNKFISALFSELAYVIYICRFLIKRLLSKKIKISMTPEEALNILNDTYPDEW